MPGRFTDDVQLKSGPDETGAVHMGKTRDVVERFYQRFGANDLDGAFACFAPECIAVELSGLLDISAHHAAALALKKAMPDCRMELVRTLEMDDEIYVTGHFEGTHTGDLYTPLGRVAASGKRLALLFVDYFRVANEEVVECEVVRDRLGMMIQLGAVPAK